MSSKSDRNARIVGKMADFHRREMRMLDKMDNRKRSGKGNEDDDYANAHITNVAEDGSKTWTY